MSRQRSNSNRMSINREQMLRAYFAYQMDRQTADICFFAHRESLMTHGCLNVFNKEELTEQMKMWRKLAKQGKLKIHDYNCKSAYLPNNNECWFLVVQAYDPSTNEIKEEQPLDPVGWFLCDELVDGYMYVFKSKKNRDAVQEYVMKGI